MVDNLLRIDTEILVIGSGPGGAMTACRLAEAGRSVLVVEEGQHVEPGRFAPFSLKQMEGQYRNAGLTVALGRPPIAYAEGRCLGGGSEINSGLYTVRLLRRSRRGAATGTSTVSTTRRWRPGARKWKLAQAFVHELRVEDRRTVHPTFRVLRRVPVDGTPDGPHDGCAYKDKRSGR